MEEEGVEVKAGGGWLGVGARGDLSNNFSSSLMFISLNSSTKGERE